MSWKVILEPQVAGVPPVVVNTFRKKEDADRKAAKLAKEYRFRGAQRPKVFVQRSESTDQLQTYAHGTRAMRDQPDLPAIGQHVTILAPTAISGAEAKPLGGG